MGFSFYSLLVQQGLVGIGYLPGYNYFHAFNDSQRVYLSGFILHAMPGGGGCTHLIRYTGMCRSNASFFARNP